MQPALRTTGFSVAKIPGRADECRTARVPKVRRILLRRGASSLTPAVIAATADRPVPSPSNKKPPDKAGGGEKQNVVDLVSQNVERSPSSINGPKNPRPSHRPCFVQSPSLDPAAAVGTNQLQHFHHRKGGEGCNRLQVAQ